MGIRYQFEPLSRENFKYRVQNNFAQTFMTMMSIIQGLSLYFLIDNAMQKYGPAAESSPALPFLIYPAISFLTLIVVLFFYSWFVSVTYRPPSMRETVVPFCLGFLQIMPTFFFGNPREWFLWQGLLMFMGIFGFLNTWVGISERDFGEGFVDAYEETKKELVRNIVICLACAIVCFSAYFIYAGGGSFSAYDWVPCALIVALLCWLSFGSERSYVRPLFLIYGLAEREYDAS